MSEEQKKIYVVVEEDIDPYCGVHPIAAFTNKEAARRYAKLLNTTRSYVKHYVQELTLYDDCNEAPTSLQSPPLEVV